MKNTFLAFLFALFLSGCFPDMSLSPTVIKEIEVNDVKVQWLRRSTAFVEVPDIIIANHNGITDTICIADNIYDIGFCQKNVGENKNLILGFVGMPKLYSDSIDMKNYIFDIHIVIDTNYIRSDIVSKIYHGIVTLGSNEIIKWHGENMKECTLSKQDVRDAEKIIVNNMQYIAQYQHDGRALITDHIDEYMRQYSGFMNEKGEKYVYIYFFIKDYCVIDVSDIPIADGGGNRFWSVWVDLSKSELRNMRVNAVI